MAEYVPTVVFDFDGVIHSYKSGWQGVNVIPDPPVPGIAEAIRDIRSAGYRVAVVSTRCEYLSGQTAIHNYLSSHGIVVDRVLAEKPPAIAYIDDRAIQFNGDASKLLDKIKSFKPGYQKEPISEMHSPDNLSSYVGQKVWLLHNGQVEQDIICCIYDKGYGWTVVTSVFMNTYWLARDLNVTLFYDEESANKALNSL